MKFFKSKRNQYLVGNPIRQTDATLLMLIKNENAFYWITASRGDFKDFLEQDEVWNERMCNELEIHNKKAAEEGKSYAVMNLEQHIDDRSYDYSSDGDLYTDYASKVNLEDQDPVASELLEA